jgi:hypothetical protein
VPSQHVAGFPVEELLGVAMVSAVPLLAFLGWEIADRVKRLRRGVRTLLRRD